MDNHSVRVWFLRQESTSWSSSVTSCLEQVAQGCVQLGFEFSGQTCSSAWPPSQEKSAFLHLGGISCISGCARGLLLSCHRAPLRRAWLPPLYFPNRMFVQVDQIPRAFSALSWTVPALSASPHMTDAPVPSLSFWPFPGLSLVCPCLVMRSPALPGLSHQRWA